MTDSSFKSTEAASSEPRQSPRKMTIFTLCVIGLLGLVFFFLSEIDDAFGQGLDVIMVGTAAIVALLTVAWVIWFAAFSGWAVWERIAYSVIVLALPFSFLALFRPVIGGDANIVGFRPIWAAAPEAPTSTPANVAVDLMPESPNDFPRFLGPNQNSTVSIAGAIDTDAFSKTELAWKQPIGLGWSGFVARNGYAVTMEQRDEQECVTCYNITSGELMWLYEHKARHRDEINMGGTGPRSTPTIHNGNVYAVGAVGNFVCLNGTDGSVVWQVDLNKLLELEMVTVIDRDGLEVQYEKDSALAWGRSGSALIVDDMVIIPGGGRSSASRKTLLAFDLATGEQRWSGGDGMIAYGSPTLATIAGIRQILMVAETEAMGFDPATGEVLWRFDRPGETNGGANTSQLTVVSDSEVLTSKGYPDGGGELIRLSNSNGTITPESVWQNKLILKTKLMSPLVYDGHSYALSNAFLECTRLADGERIWKHRGRFGHGQMLLVNDQILLHSELGTLYLLKATPDGYQEFGQIPTIEGVCWNTLCLYGDKLLVRSHLEAACIELPIR